MTDSPKRIWIVEFDDPADATAVYTSAPDNFIPNTEYVRADVDELATELGKQLQSDHRDLMRAAFNLCMTTPRPNDWNDLWALCKGYDPTEVEQGLVPIPVEYNER